MPCASPRCSNRRPAPLNSWRTPSASPRAIPASSSAASATAALCRLCSPGTRSSNDTGSSSSPRTCDRAAASQRSKSSRTSSSDANVAWWSSSTFVSTATRGWSSSSDRSDSSPSATSHPSPARALPPSWGISPPIRNAGSCPSRSRQKAIIPAVVVFPCAPATTIDGRSSTSSASSSPRFRTARPATSGLSGATALETITSASAGTFAASWPMTPAIPAASRRSTYEEPALSEPPTSAPHSRTASASALMPAPPIPTNQKRLPSSKREQLLRDHVGGIRPGDVPHGRAHLLAAASVVEQRPNDLRNPAELSFRHEDRPARGLEEPRVLRLVVGGRERIRDEHRREPCCGELPDGRAAAHEGEIACTVGRTEPVEDGHE